MGKKEDTAYAEWLKEYESTLDTDELKGAFKLLTGQSEKGKEIFRAGLREADYYRRLNELNEKGKVFDAERQELGQKADQLKQWFEAEKPKNEMLMDEQKKLKRKIALYEAELGEKGLEDAEGVKAMKQAVEDVAKRDELESLKKEFEDKLRKLDQVVPIALSEMSNVVYRAVKEDYELDPSKVMEYSLKNGVAPMAAFEILTKDEREKRAKDTREKEIAKAREEGAREALSKHSSPDHIRPSGPTVLDSLRSDKAPLGQQERIDAAVQSYLSTTQGS